MATASWSTVWATWPSLTPLPGHCELKARQRPHRLPGGAGHRPNLYGWAAGRLADRACRLGALREQRVEPALLPHPGRGRRAVVPRVLSDSAASRFHQCRRVRPTLVRSRCQRPDGTVRGPETHHGWHAQLLDLHPAAGHHCEWPSWDGDRDGKVWEGGQNTKDRRVLVKVDTSVYMFGTYYETAAELWN